MRFLLLQQDGVTGGLVATADVGAVGGVHVHGEEGRRVVVRVEHVRDALLRKLANPSVSAVLEARPRAGDQVVDVIGSVAAEHAFEVLAVARGQVEVCAGEITGERLVRGAAGDERLVEGRVGEIPGPPVLSEIVVGNCLWGVGCEEAIHVYVRSGGGLKVVGGG